VNLHIAVNHIGALAICVTPIRTKPALEVKLDPGETQAT